MTELEIKEQMCEVGRRAYNKAWWRLMMETFP